MVNAKFGLNLNGDDVSALGQKALGMETDFNRRAGFGKADDRLPEFSRTEKLPPHDEVFDVPDEHLDSVFKFD